LGEQVRNFYIELLKRMDDSNDRIRIECARAFDKFMASVPRNYDSAQFDYIVRGLVLHLDDQNPQVALALSLALDGEISTHRCMRMLTLVCPEIYESLRGAT
jgi:hypothetical protein